MTQPLLDPVLVTGGTGRAGARLVRRLKDRSVAVRAGSRHAPASFDWRRPNEEFAADLAHDGTPADFGTYASRIASTGVYTASARAALR